MHRILFVDGACPRPYDGNTLETEPQGGTESTVTRVAEGLAQRGHAVRIAQHNRTERADVHGVEHRSFGEIGDFGPTHVVVLRTSTFLDQISAKWPHARGFAWYHDRPRPGENFGMHVEALIRTRGTAILVSRWHLTQWRECLLAQGYAEDATRAVRVYNPVPEHLRPDDTPVDPDKFVFFSIPDKGLRETVDFFNRFRDHPRLRDARLHVASPGYREVDVEIAADRVVQLGSLPWKRVIEELRGAFMLLDCNTHMPEAFGLLHAEADAVGTPWIGAPMGANPEVCSHPDEMMDLSDPDAVLARLLHWREHGRPQVRGREEFRTSAVMDAWEALLGEAW
jgi:glycosyltransferase involved in cell wall biosynthesis